MNKKILTAALASSIIFGNGVNAFASETNKIDINQDAEVIQAQLNDLIRLAEPIAEGNGENEETIAKIKSQMASLSSEDFIKEVPNMERKLNAIIYKDDGKEKVNKKELEEAYEDGVYAYENDIIGENGSKEELLRALEEAKTLLKSPNVSRDQVVQISDSIRYNIGVEINEFSADLSNLRKAIKDVENLNDDNNKKIINSAKSLLLSNPNQEDVDKKTNELKEVLKISQEENILETKNKAINTIKKLNLDEEKKSSYEQSILNTENLGEINSILENAKSESRDLDLEEFNSLIDNLEYLTQEEKQSFIDQANEQEDIQGLYQQAIDLNYENLKIKKDDLLKDVRNYKHIKVENINNAKDEFYKTESLEEAKNLLSDYLEKFDNIEEAVIKVENLANLTDEQMQSFSDKLNNYEDIDVILNEATRLNDSQQLVERYSKEEVVELREKLISKLEDQRLDENLREKSEEVLALSNDILSDSNATLKELDNLGKALYEQFTEVQNYLLDLDTVKKPIDDTEKEQKAEIDENSEQPVEKDNTKTTVVNTSDQTPQTKTVNNQPNNVITKNTPKVLVNKDNLNKTILKAEEFIKEGKGTKEQNNRLNETLKKAREIYNNEKATQSEVDNIEKELLNIMNITYNEVKSDVKTGVEGVFGTAGLLSVAAMAYLANKKR